MYLRRIRITRDIRIKKLYQGVESAAKRCFVNSFVERDGRSGWT